MNERQIALAELDELADRAAPLDALLVDAALGPMRQLAPTSSTVRFAAGLARHPVATGRRLGGLAAELARVGVGTSTHRPVHARSPVRRPGVVAEPAAAPGRAGATWPPVGPPSELVDDAELGWRDDRRVRFLVDNLIEALSPSNVPLAEPGVGEGGHGHRRREPGARRPATCLRDMAAPPRVPQMVDASPFEVGRNIAARPGAVVLRTELLELIQYRPQTEHVREVPLLIAPPTINKYYALDLAPGRSLVEHLVRSGQQVFVISWRNPDARHADWGFDTYVQAVLGRPRRGERDLRHRPGGAVRLLLGRHPVDAGRRRT